jgi:hypothetical protein
MERSGSACIRHLKRVFTECRQMQNCHLIVNPSQNTTYNINYVLQQQVSTQMSHHQAAFETIFEVYKVTVHIWDLKGLQRFCCEAQLILYIVF